MGRQKRQRSRKSKVKSAPKIPKQGDVPQAATLQANAMEADDKPQADIIAAQVERLLDEKLAQYFERNEKRSTESSLSDSEFSNSSSSSSGDDSKTYHKLYKEEVEAIFRLEKENGRLVKRVACAEMEVKSIDDKNFAIYRENTFICKKREHTCDCAYEKKFNRYNYKR